MATSSSEAVSVPLAEKRRGKPVRLRTWLRVWRTFRPLARKHMRSFWASTVAAAFVVGSRLLFPWPLKALLKPWLKADSILPGSDPTAVTLDASWSEHVLLYAGAFLAIVLVFGYADYRQRVHVARFAIGWVRDIRAEAFRAAHRLGSTDPRVRSGDIVSRLVGDTARLKAGLKGFLVHVATNGMLFLGITVVLLWVSPRLAWIQALGWTGVLVVTVIGARKVYQRSLNYRRKEGKIADRIQEAILRNPQEASFTKMNYSSGQHEAALATIQGRVTFAAHVILGAATVAALAAGIAGLRSGATSIEGLFVFVMYARTMHKPGVRLARQGTRLGKVVACAERLEKLIRSAEGKSRKLVDAPPLRTGLRLKRTEVVAPDGRRVLGPLDLRIPAGQKILLSGPAGSGKTLFLRLLAGRTRPSEGKVLFDELKVHRIDRQRLAELVGLAGVQPSWIRKPLRLVLGFAEGEEGRRQLRRWQEAGFLGFVDALPSGLDTRVSVQSLSTRQAREVDLVRHLAAPSSVLLLDEPFEVLDEHTGRSFAAWLAEVSGRTVVITSRKPISGLPCDRWLRLREGRIEEDRSLAAGGSA